MASVTVGVGVDGHRLSREAPLVEDDQSSLIKTLDAPLREYVSDYSYLPMDPSCVLGVGWMLNKLLMFSLRRVGGVQLCFDLDC